MRRFILPVLLFASLISQGQNINLDLELFAMGISKPTAISHAGDDRLFVTGQNGTIKIIMADGTVAETPFLDISSKVATIGEQGLLGLAFHPEYSANGFFYVYYSMDVGNKMTSVISRFEKDATNDNLADESTETVLLTFEQPQSNHNGGHLAFGPDKKLYIGSGDGGKQGDPDGNSQNKNTLLGKLLRLDVDIPAPYIPQDNPFINQNARGEIWAFGLRNPWKFSFDEETGEVWIADVGLNTMEEVSKMSSNAAGINYGWNCFEGSVTITNGSCPNSVDPIITYETRGVFGRSITGGHVYRGTEFPELQGKYIFADFTKSALLMTENDGGDITSFTPSSTKNVAYSTFGENKDKDLFAANYSNGTIHKVINSTPLSIPSFSKNKNTIFPNPMQHYFTLKSDTPIIRVQLFDLKGVMVKTFNPTNNNQEYDVSEIKSGLYLLRLTDHNNEELQQKIVIQ